MTTRILIAAALSLTLLGCGGKPPASAPALVAESPPASPYGPDGVLRADVSKLKSTVVAATLDEPIVPGKNILWCSTFQLAWNELCDQLGGDIRLEGGSTLADSLNKRAATKADLDDASYVAMAGRASQGFWDKVRAALREKFPNETFRLVEPSVPHDLAAYAALVKDLEFEHPFESRDDRVMFFGGRPTRFFGISEGSIYEGPRWRQVEVLDMRRARGGVEAVLELKTQSPDDRLILAMLQPGASLGETIAEVRRRLAPKPEPAPDDDPRLSYFDELAVPKLNVDLLRTYDELEGRRVLNVKLPFTDAKQLVRFKLDENGARLKSEATATIFAGDLPKLVFDRPFLILMEQKGAKAPYFALWVDNAELLVPESPERLALLKKLVFDAVHPFSEGLAAVRVHNRWGYVDAEGRWVAKPQFAAAGDFREGRARVAESHEEIETMPVVPARPPGTYEDNGVYTVLDDGTDGRPSSVFSKHETKWGFIDRTGKLVIPKTFDGAWSFSDGLACVSIGNELEESDDLADDTFHGPFLGESMPGKRGYIDTSGKQVIAPAYDYARPFKDGVAWVGTGPVSHPESIFGDKAQRVYRLIDRRGGVILDGLSDRGEFSEGLAAAKKGDLWGYVDKTGRWVLAPQFDDADRFVDGNAWVEKDKRPGFIDRAQAFSPWEFVSSTWNDEIRDGRMAFEDNATKRWGFADMRGKVVIAAEFANAEPFSEGRAAVIKEGAWFGYIDANGLPVTPFDFYEAKSFHEGLAAVRVEGKGWGYVDRAGKFVIDCTFAEAKGFREGFAPVAIRAGANSLGYPMLKWGFVDKSGKVLQIGR